MILSASGGRNLRPAQQIAQRLGFGPQFVCEIGAFFDHFLETVSGFARPVGDGSQGVIAGAPQVFPQLSPSLRSEQQTDGGADAKPDQQKSNCCADRTVRTLIFSNAHINLLMISILDPNVELVICDLQLLTENLAIPRSLNYKLPNYRFPGGRVSTTLSGCVK